MFSVRILGKKREDEVIYGFTCVDEYDVRQRKEFACSAEVLNSMNSNITLFQKCRHIFRPFLHRTVQVSCSPRDAILFEHFALCNFQFKEKLASQRYRTVQKFKTHPAKRRFVHGAARDEMCLHF
uniref:PID domain-containing protein n=1 Tax=Bursaphelenchus xylophilus TaxID=6326 RepID=A0A1I7SPK2_BURXY